MILVVSANVPLEFYAPKIIKVEEAVVDLVAAGNTLHLCATPNNLS
jgi:hypothetical protein